ncbi:MAG: NifB/NifX family molybdenum-iron cluster-binding protein [Halanaerobiaceae bacterium]
MKKIAVPSDGDQFAPHFGRCPEYTLFDIDEGVIKDKEVIPNPGHKPGYLPRFLNEQGVDCIIASGMGRKAQDLFEQHNIDVVIGVQGEIDKGVEAYINGELEQGENICSH